MKISFEEAANAVGGRTTSSSNRLLKGVAADSRLVSDSDLFVALSGDHRDGHDFVIDAFVRGAAAAIVEREIPGAPGPLIVVEDTRGALWELAAWVRDGVDPLVVGITGSIGKTSTKDLLASVASHKFSTVASRLSYNTEVGVPLTLLSIGAHTELVICEMGARGRGQITALAQIARPHLGVVTNVGITHYEQFGSREAIAAAKGELVEALPEGGTAILNADDPQVKSMAGRTRADVLMYGTSSDAWLRGERVDIDAWGRPSFRMARDNDAVWVTLEMLGRHQVMNALAASCAALALGMSLEDCRIGLEAARGSPWRMEVHRAGEVVIVNDAFSSSPDSVASALETCSAMVSDSGRLIAVLGYMAELGEIESREHERVGEMVAARAGRLIVISEAASGIAVGSRRAGMTEVEVVEDGAAALGALGELSPGDVVLVKASRVIGLERLAWEIERKAAAL